MLNRVLILVLLIELFLLSVRAEAANHYVRAGASGNSSGADWTNAMTSLPATLIRGDTYYVADGTYSSYTFDDPESGTQIITIKKATIGDHGTSTGWNNSYGDGQAIFAGNLFFETSHYIIDGQVGGGPLAWFTGHGIKIDDGLIYTNGHNTTNLNLLHIEIDQNSQDPSDESRCAQLQVTSNITFSYCYFHDVGGADFMQVNNITNLTVEYSAFANAYVDPGHPDLVQLYGGRGENFIFRYNYITNVDATYYWGAHSSGSDVLNNARIYGNIIELPAGTGVSNGIVATLSSGGVVSNLEFYNNTILGVYHGRIGFSGNLRGSNNRAYNNLFYREGGTDYTVGFGDAIHENNTFFNTMDVSGEEVLTGNPFINYGEANYQLSNPIGNSSVLVFPFNVDMYGTIRGGDGVWDRGAFEYVSNASSLNPPNNLRIE